MSSSRSECYLNTKSSYNHDYEYADSRKEQALFGRKGFHNVHTSVNTTARGREEVTGLVPAPVKMSMFAARVVEERRKKYDHTIIPSYDQMIISSYDHNDPKDRCNNEENETGCDQDHHKRDDPDRNRSNGKIHSWPEAVKIQRPSEGAPLQKCGPPPKAQDHTVAGLWLQQQPQQQWVSRPAAPPPPASFIAGTGTGGSMRQDASWINPAAHNAGGSGPPEPRAQSSAQGQALAAAKASAVDCCRHGHP